MNNFIKLSKGLFIAGMVTLYMLSIASATEVPSGYNTAEYGVGLASQYLLNYQEIQAQLQSEDQSGTGIF